MKMTVRHAIATTAIAFGACGGSGGTGPSAVAPVGPASIAGLYTLTITASAACAEQLPDALKHRTYQATITQSASSFAVNLIGQFDANAFSGTLSGTDVTFGWAFLERDNQQFLSGTLQGAGRVEGSTIRGTMLGPLSVSGVSSSGGSTCNAADHQFVFTR